MRNLTDEGDEGPEDDCDYGDQSWFPREAARSVVPRLCSCLALQLLSPACFRAKNNKRNDALKW